MPEFTVERRVPNRYTTLRWCVVRNHEIICHRDYQSEALEMARRFNLELEEAKGGKLSTVGRIMQMVSTNISERHL